MHLNIFKEKRCCTKNADAICSACARCTDEVETDVCSCCNTFGKFITCQGCECSCYCCQTFCCEPQRASLPPPPPVKAPVVTKAPAAPVKATAPAKPTAAPVKKTN